MAMVHRGGSAMWGRLAVGLVTTLAFATRVDAGPALLFDAADGRVLYAEDQDDQWHPASLTKIMTAYVVFEALRDGPLTLDTTITCSQLASSQPPTRVGMVPGAKMTVKQALQALILHSANDVAVMLGEAVEGTNDAFVERMNATAAKLGMTRTKFMNAKGLPHEDQVTTARDLARLASAVLRDYPEHAALWSTLDVHIGRRHFGTYNGLLVNYAGADGMKTGFTCDSGYNVVASATRSGQKLIAVVLGEATSGRRTVRASSLLEHGFATSDWKKLFPSERIDTLPMNESAKKAASIRHTVISWACGTARQMIAAIKGKNTAATAEGGEAAARKKVLPKAKGAPASAAGNWSPW
jgi:D-alanyl-D-alanine carboxypeptidase